MFLGDFQHTLDAKGRVSLPAKFRNQLSGSIVVAKGLEGCLYVYPAEAYNAFLAGLVKGNDFDPEARRVRRFFTSGATETELDGAGRVMLPPVLREYAELKRDVSITGNGDRIEIWDAQAWAAYNGETTEHNEDAAKELAAKGIGIL
jgi:MraZ protein